jgi:16S rRNA processing protein RimM
MRLQKQMFLMKLQGIDDIDQTKFLMNEMCFREVEKNESNDDEGYFIKDLVGIEVIDESGNTIGTLKEVFRTGANDVYEVVDKNNKSIYLPAIKKVIKSIDISSRKMTVELMEGL